MALIELGLCVNAYAYSRERFRVAPPCLVRCLWHPRTRFDRKGDVEAERVANLVEFDMSRVAGGGQTHALRVAFLRMDRRGGTGALCVAPQDQLGHGAEHRSRPQHDRVIEGLARGEGKGDMCARGDTVAIEVEAMAPGFLREDNV